MTNKFLIRLAKLPSRIHELYHRYFVCVNAWHFKGSHPCYTISQMAQRHVHSYLRNPEYFGKKYSIYCLRCKSLYPASDFDLITMEGMPKFFEDLMFK